MLWLRRYRTILWLSCKVRASLLCCAGGAAAAALAQGWLHLGGDGRALQKQDTRELLHALCGTRQGSSS
jgi:hypothetical protein